MTIILAQIIFFVGQSLERRSGVSSLELGTTFVFAYWDLGCKIWLWLTFLHSFLYNRWLFLAAYLVSDQ